MIQRLLYFALSFTTGLYSLNAEVTRIQCAGNDIELTGVTITGVTPKSITYQYSIFNAGTTTLTFDKLMLTNFVSYNATYEVTDQAASSTSLTYTGQTQLAAGASYTNSYTTTFTVFLVDYPHLIVALTYADGECSASNNTEVKCTRPDPEFSSLYITGISSNYAGYDFTIKNIGGDTLFFNKLILQNYVSSNTTYDLGDGAAGGSFLSFIPVPYILANQSYTYSFGANYTNIASNAYLIAWLNYMNSECNTSNNWAIIPMQVTSVLSPSDNLENFVQWNREAKSFIIESWGSAGIRGALQYKLYNVSGSLVASGAAKLGVEIPVTGKREGVYMLVISDEQTLCAKKIAY